MIIIIWNQNIDYYNLEPEYSFYNNFNQNIISPENNKKLYVLNQLIDKEYCKMYKICDILNMNYSKYELLNFEFTAAYAMLQILIFIILLYFVNLKIVSHLCTF